MPITKITIQSFSLHPKLLICSGTSTRTVVGIAMWPCSGARRTEPKEHVWLCTRFQAHQILLSLSDTNCIYFEPDTVNTKPSMIGVDKCLPAGGH